MNTLPVPNVFAHFNEKICEQEKGTVLAWAIDAGWAKAIVQELNSPSKPRLFTFRIEDDLDLHAANGTDVDAPFSKVATAASPGTAQSLVALLNHGDKIVKQLSDQVLGHYDDCPLSDPETMANPATAGLPCTCGDRERQEEDSRSGVLGHSKLKTTNAMLMEALGIADRKIARFSMECLPGHEPVVTFVERLPDNNLGPWQEFMLVPRSVQAGQAANITDTAFNNSVEEVWESFWKEIVMVGPDHTLCMQAVKNELFDYHTAISEVPKAYCELTGSRLSKVNTRASAVVDAANEHHDRCRQDTADDAREEVAAILETIAKEGLPGPRDLDVAIEAIYQHLGFDT